MSRDIPETCPADRSTYPPIHRRPPGCVACRLSFECVADTPAKYPRFVAGYVGSMAGMPLPRHADNVEMPQRQIYVFQQEHCDNQAVPASRFWDRVMRLARLVRDCIWTAWTGKYRCMPEAPVEMLRGNPNRSISRSDPPVIQAARLRGTG